MLKLKSIPTIALGLTIAFFVLSCGTQDKAVKNYKPLTKIKGLEVDNSQKPTLVYTRPGAPKLDAYDAFIIDPIIVDQRAGGKKIEAKDAQRVKDYFKKSVIEELEDGGYEIRTSAAENTLRISFVLSGLKTPSAAPNVTQIVFPLTLSVGGVTVEATFKEAVSDRIDAVVINRSEGARAFNASPWSTWADVESALDKWAKGIRESVDQAHGK